MGKTLIINADDLGYDPEVTRGILLAMREGVVSSATFMVNTPFSEAAAREAGGLSLGLHLNLARGGPVSSALPADLLVDGGLHEPNADRLPPEGVSSELRAQVDRFEQLLGRAPTHLDVHKHLHRHANVLEGIIIVARERGLPVRSISVEMRSQLRAAGVRTNDHFIGDAGQTAWWTVAQLESDLARLEDGVTELMCHPGYAPSQVKSGYSAQREVELQTFLDPRAPTMLQKADVTLTDFSALQRTAR